jgi:Protein of unknown function (DUF2721)
MTGHDKRMNLPAVSAITAMVAPVVLITTSGMLTNGLLGAHHELYGHIRAMTRERLDIRPGPNGALLSPDECSPIGQERLREIGHQLPNMLHRVRLLRSAVTFIYFSITVLVLSVIFIGVAVLLRAESFGLAALVLALSGAAGLVIGPGVAERTIVRPMDVMSYAVERTAKEAD